MTWCAINAREVDFASGAEVSLMSHGSTTDDTPSARPSQCRGAILQTAEKISSIERGRTRTRCNRKVPRSPQSDPGSSRVRDQVPHSDGGSSDQETAQVGTTSNMLDNLRSSASRTSTLNDDFDDGMFDNWSESDLQLSPGTNYCVEARCEKGLGTHRGPMEDMDDDLFGGIPDDVLQILVDDIEHTESQRACDRSAQANQHISVESTSDGHISYVHQCSQDDEFDDFDETVFDAL